MCGINAVINGSFEQVQAMQKATQRRGITSAITSIGNDWVSFDHLPITDKNVAAGPFKSGSFTVWMNGYISNYRELAEKYDIKLETNCDTEFLAKFIDLHNEYKLDELNGFFSVLVHNRCHIGNEWSAYTDRYGIKQLYTYKQGSATFISSEVKGILAVCPDIELDETAVTEWKQTLGVVTKHTIYKGIKRVMQLPLNIPEKRKISYDQAKRELSRLLHQSFERNKYDGESGVYLSGGVDSGLIAHWMRPEYSFSVDYVDSAFSETDLIKINSTGIHHSIIVNRELADIYTQKTMLALDDLKAGSCYTNFAIAELASKFVRVMYSGAGGDEFFGGYPHRKSKDINEVVYRVDVSNEDELLDYGCLSHFEYDLEFLRAVLVVEDRMSGWHTMETRYPLLDNDLVDFAMSLPDDYLENKRILKDVCGLHEDVVNGKKKGFSNPYFSNSEWAEFALKNLRR